MTFTIQIAYEREVVLLAAEEQPRVENGVQQQMTNGVTGAHPPTLHIHPNSAAARLHCDIVVKPLLSSFIQRCVSAHVCTLYLWTVQCVSSARFVWSSVPTGNALA